MERSGALAARAGARTPSRQPGVIARPVYLIGRGSIAHAAALPAHRRPTYRRLRVGGPLPSIRPLRRAPRVPRNTRHGGQASGHLPRLGASPRLVVATLTVLVLILGAASTSLA